MCSFNNRDLNKANLTPHFYPEQFIKAQENRLEVILLDIVKLIEILDLKKKKQEN